MDVLKIIILAMLVHSNANARCVIYYDELPLTQPKQDVVSALLNQEMGCSDSIQSFRQLIHNNNLRIKTAMVANRGKNNPQSGSFSFFESITGTMPDGFQINKGSFYLGYFSYLHQDEIRLDSLPEQNKLLIELIAWDKEKHLFNFYELRGLNTQKTRWYYRGNSEDAVLDNQYLYREPPLDSAKFGHRMRCSACHNSGGPIMKEMKAPHNDWWTDSNRLIFFPNHPDDEVNLLINALVDAREFSNEVMSGIRKLNKSITFNTFRHEITLQEQLRPLFCTSEINIESDKTSGTQDLVTIPSGFWINPLLDEVKTAVPGQAYNNLLTENNMMFPETQLKDADHAWLTPVKGVNDINAIRQLINNKMITRHFAQSVLMIDFAHPVFSGKRCELLKLIPSKPDSGWLSIFVSRLYQIQKQQPDALLLASYITNPEKYNQKYFRHLLRQYKREIKSSVTSPQGLQQFFNQLIQTRGDVFENELSKNPLGQILEPGFRVIFPVQASGAQVSFEYSLSTKSKAKIC